MNLVIDEGNTFTKLGVFDKGKMIHFNSCKILDEIQLKKDNYLNNIDKVIVSSVKENYQETNSFIKKTGLDKISQILILNGNTPLPVKNNYETPESLGKDRIAALVGASTLYEGCPKLVIDAGTAITIDLLDENNCFTGGNISPGIQTRFNSLHQNTKLLPLLKIDTSSNFMGLNTKQAICSGVQNGVIFEIESYINHFTNLNINTKTILTGGDADFFAKKLKNRIFVNSNLVLTGLNNILEYNA